MVAITKANIGHALQEEMQLWHSHQSAALRGLKYPRFATEPQLLSYAWLNLGMNATKSLYPNTTAATLASVVTSIGGKWYIGMAQAAFLAVYKSIADDGNAKLDARYQELQSSFVNEIDRLERTTRNAPFFLDVIDQIYHHWQGREFRDGNQMIADCRALIHQAGIVETRSDVIETRTKRGYEKLCEKIFWISEGIGWSSTIRYSPSQKTYITPYYQGKKWLRISKSKHSHWLLSHAWQFDVRYVDRSFKIFGLDIPSERPNTTFVTHVNHLETPLKLARTFKGPRIDLAMAERAAGSRIQHIQSHIQSQ